MRSQGQVQVQGGGGGKGFYHLPHRRSRSKTRRGRGGNTTYLLQLLILEVASDHHLEDDEQLAVTDVAVSIDIVHFEREPQLLLLSALAAEGTQARHELLEVDVAATVLVEDRDHAAKITRICQFRRRSDDLGEGNGR